MGNRVIAVFCGMILLFSGVFYRVSSLSMGSEGLAQVAQRQSTYTLEVAAVRGAIYDCNLKLMVNDETEYRAAILPCPQSASEMKRLILDQELFLKRLEERLPFVTQADTDQIFVQGIEAFAVPRRYGQRPSAVHLIGHLRDGEGVYGLEKAYNGFLEENGGVIQVRYPVDATGRPLSGEEIQVTNTLKEPDARRGLVLTIDSQIQRIAEYAARKYISKGAVVVLDCNTGAVKASVSLPEFDPNHPAESLDTANSPFVNKAFSAFSVGSTFKLVVTAAALEAGVQPGAVECTGSVDVDGQVFRCNNHAGHGWVDLKRGLEVSCNPYFIHLAQRVGGTRLREMALKMGFGSANRLAEDYQSAAGRVPERDELQNPADVANFGFGQGVLMATPLQLARMVSVFANGGLLVEPRLIEGVCDGAGEAMLEREPQYAANRVVSEETAERVRELMVNVVEEGSGRNARPETGGAGGKTASAQTGRYYDEERTNEIVEAWFAGFFPAENPRYTIVVLAEGADSGSSYAAPIFKEIADSILALQEN